MTTNTAPRVNQLAIKVDGSNLDESVMTKLLYVEVDTSLDVPSMFIMQFQDDEITLVDADTFNIGKSVEIQFPDADGTLVSVITGEITSNEPNFTDSFTETLTIRGYDKGHRLNRGMYTRSWDNASDSDIVQAIAKEAGLSVQADSTAAVYEHVIQHNQTNYAFMRERADLNGFQLIFKGEKLYFGKGGSGSQINLEWGSTLRSFHPRLTSTEQVTGADVHGWDITQKQALMGTVTTGTMTPSTGISKTPEAVAQTFGSGKYVEVHRPLYTQSQSQTLATSLLSQIESGFVEAEGVAFGTPTLVAGEKVKLTKLGTRFSGTYFVTSATHTFASATGYDTHFVIEGVHRRLTADLLDNNRNAPSVLGGVFPALVTGNKDPNNMGRVKLKYPWLDDQIETGWTRITTVGGGKKRGIHWLPEINDEVLVAFEHGDFDHPYVLGGLYNGKDSPPAQATDIVPSGAVEKHFFQTDKHVISLNNAPSEETIEIKDLEGQTVVRLTNKPGGKIEIISKGTEIDITCDSGKVNVSAQNVTVKASQNAEVSGMSVKVEASGQLELKGANVSLEGSTAVKIQGGMVNIN